MAQTHTAQGWQHYRMSWYDPHRQIELDKHDRLQTGETTWHNQAEWFDCTAYYLEPQRYWHTGWRNGSPPLGFPKHSRIPP